jgi:hypothetical protein
VDAKEYVHWKSPAPVGPMLGNLTMTSLQDKVEACIQEFGFNELGSNWHVETSGPWLCSLRSNDYLIRVNMDPRNDMVTSSINFLADGLPIYETLDTHVVIKLLTDSRNVGDSDSIQTVTPEMEKVRRILLVLKRGDLNPRDMYYFTIGYNCAYTAYFT